MTLTLQPIRVATGFDEDGMMVLDRQRLVAVLVHLAHDNEVAPGHWYLEAGFGRIDGGSKVESALVVEICGRAGCWDEVVIGRTGYGGVARLHPSGRNPNDRRQTTTGRADGEGR